MDAILKTKWVEALRNGKYNQTTHSLKDSLGFCCLGVLCDIQGADFDAIREEFGGLSLSSNPVKYLGGLPMGFSVKVASMNDVGKTFPEIADYIEANL
jgi:hypothetical protein